MGCRRHTRWTTVLTWKLVLPSRTSLNLCGWILSNGSHTWNIRKFLPGVSGQGLNLTFDRKYEHSESITTRNIQGHQSLRTVADQAGSDTQYGDDHRIDIEHWRSHHLHRRG